MNDGRIVAADLSYYANAGCKVDESVLVSGRGNEKTRSLQKNVLTILSISLQIAEKFLLHMENAYSIPNLRGSAAACKTNLPSNTAFRGFGVPQCLFVIENMVNDVAVLLGRPADQVTPHLPGFEAERGI